MEINIDKKNPKNISLSGEFNFDDKVIIITDDVANTGKTLLYALNPFLIFIQKKYRRLFWLKEAIKHFRFRRIM